MRFQANQQNTNNNRFYLEQMEFKSQSSQNVGQDGQKLKGYSVFEMYNVIENINRNLDQKYITPINKKLEIYKQEQQEQLANRSYNNSLSRNVRPRSRTTTNFSQNSMKSTSQINRAFNQSQALKHLNPEQTYSNFQSKNMNLTQTQLKFTQSSTAKLNMFTPIKSEYNLTDSKSQQKQAFLQSGVFDGDHLNNKKIQKQQNVKAFSPSLSEVQLQSTDADLDEPELNQNMFSAFKLNQPHKSLVQNQLKEMSMKNRILKLQGIQTNLSKQSMISSKRPRTASQIGRFNNQNRSFQQQARSSKVTLNNKDDVTSQDGMTKEIQRIYSNQLMQNTTQQSNLNKTSVKPEKEADASQLSLHHGHHLLKSIVSYNSQNYYQKLQQDRFMNEFNINDRNEQYKQARECHGFRLSEIEKAYQNMKFQKETELSAKNQGKNDNSENNMKFLKISNLNFDSKKEWKLNQLLQDKQLKELQEKKFQQQQILQAKRNPTPLRNANPENMDKNKDHNNILEFADELFSFWDEQSEGFISIDTFVRDLLSLGLAPSADFLIRMISIVLKIPFSQISKAKLSLKDFQKLGNSSRLVNRILKILNDQVQYNISLKKKATSSNVENLRHQNRSMVSSSKNQYSTASGQNSPIKLAKSRGRADEDPYTSLDKQLLDDQETKYPSNNGQRIIEEYDQDAVQMTKKKLKYHHKLLILHEIVSDVQLYKDLKDSDLAKDYQEKLGLINQRRDMINYLNQKYGASAKLFLDILVQFKSNPHHILTQPNKKVKKLISETLEKYLRDNTQPFEFRNSNLGDMYDLLISWWDELKGGSDKKISEVPRKEFLKFVLKKRIIVDEKELDSLFKDLTGDQSLNEKPFLKQNEFLRIFLRSCFKGALQNVYDFIVKSSIILKSLPISIRVLSYQRQLLYAGIVSISNPKKNKRGLDGKIVLKALTQLLKPDLIKFQDLKKSMLKDYKELQGMNQDSEDVFYNKNKQSDEKTDQDLILEVIESDEESIASHITKSKSAIRNISGQANQFKYEEDSNLLTVQSLLHQHTGYSEDLKTPLSFKSKSDQRSINANQLPVHHKTYINIQERPMSSETNQVNQNTFYITQQRVGSSQSRGRRLRQTIQKQNVVVNQDQRSKNQSKDLNIIVEDKQVIQSQKSAKGFNGSRLLKNRQMRLLSAKSNLKVNNIEAPIINVVEMLI
eukprot:403339546